MLFLFLYHLKINASCLVNGFVQVEIYSFVASFIMFMVNFDITKSKALVHQIDPTTTQFGRGVLAWPIVKSCTQPIFFKN